MAAGYAAAETDLAQTEVLIDDVSARVARLRDRMRRIQERLQIRAREAYEGAGTNALELLLTSESFSQFSDRVEFLGNVVQDDRDLMIQAKVTREELRRSQADLDSLSSRQSATVASLVQQRNAIASKLTEAQQLQASLERKLQQERAAVAAVAAASASQTTSAAVRSGGALQACPVGQPRAFVDSFGAPRSGGRTHQGIDLMAPYGTPIYAAQSGRFEQNYNSLGGISALLYAGNGDSTYYAHLSTYAGVANGATVSAGTMIGRVGSTGNAGSANHLHFEYHPGGGSAINPYGMLRSVCG